MPKLLLSALLAPLGLAAWGSAQAATTYYVRTDGGDASQCTGRADAPYPGSGTGQACAWKHPFYALAPGGGKRIAGGDTLLIGSGSYMMGQGAPGAGSCSAGSCYMAAIPSGTASAPTRILGKGKVTLWGTKGTKTVLNLDGSSYVEVGNLEVTDHDDCVYQHSNATANCASGGGWARDGLRASASRNVWLHDLDIHGLAAAGMYAGGLTDWTLDRVKVNYNGRVGWNANIGSGSSSAGQIVMRDIEIAWNGCGQRWQTGEPWACWAQQTGGYGDGLGTTTTGGKWLVEDAFVHHNTSDGLDFRYMDGASGTSVTLRRVYSVANAGNQVKVKGNSLIENSVLVSQCGYFDGRYFMTSGDQCRAGGNTVQLVFTSNNTAVVRHNTITGESGVLIGAIEGDGSNKVLVQNNIIVGFPTFQDPNKLSSVYYANSTGVVDSWAGNLVWNVKNNTCPSGSICGQNPRLKDMRLASFDAEPLQDSPAIDKVPALSSLTTDFLLQRRPSGKASDIGAYEMQAAGTTTRQPAKSDFNGDGKSDILWRNSRTGSDVIWKSGNANAPQGMTNVSDLAWRIVGTGDFDGDGASDVLWRNKRDGRNVIWRSGSYNATLAVRGVSNPDWQIVGTGDFNGDGRSDILWRNGRTGSNVIWKSGNYATAQAMTSVTDLSWTIVGTGDFDGDGSTDVLWRNKRDGRNAIWRSGNYNAALAVRGVSNLDWAIVGTGDFNGDGRSDILWRNAHTGANVIWKSGNYSTAQAMTRVSDLAWTITGTGDFDGNGSTDVLWRNQRDGRNAIWLGASYNSPMPVERVADLSWKIQH